MSNSSAPTKLWCISTSHLFSQPLCEDQSLLKRIVNVAFHVLTLGIPLAIYHTFSCCYAKGVSKLEDGNLQTTAINSVRQGNKDTPDSALNQEAVDHMQEEITSKITEEYSKILNLIDKYYNNPFRQTLVNRQL